MRGSLHSTAPAIPCTIGKTCAVPPGGNEKARHPPQPIDIIAGVIFMEPEGTYGHLIE